jgi:hypothetical protein
VTVPRETRWVVDCLRALARGERRPLAPASLDWSRVAATIDAESVGPAIALACEDRSGGDIPSAARDRWRRERVEATARHLVMTAELGRLLKAFAREPIAMIPLKGPALAELIYPDPAVRPCSDLDLLIRPDDIVRADARLHELGYRRVADAHSFDFDVVHDRATLYETSSGVRVDLHWSLLSEPRYSWDEHAAAVWERAVPTSVGGQEGWSLCPEDLVLYLAAHLAVHHGVAGLLWQYDLFLLIERSRDALDWSTISRRARHWRVRTAVYFALRMVDELFDAGVPERFLQELEPRGVRAAAMRWILRRRGPAERRAAEHLIGLLLIDRGRDVVSALRAVVLPPADWLAARYGGGSALRRYVAHGRRLGDVVSQAAAGLRPRRR